MDHNVASIQRSKDFVLLVSFQKKNVVNEPKFITPTRGVVTWEQIVSTQSFNLKAFK